eukprot:g14038.t1
MGYACSDLALAGADTACLGVLLLVRGISRLGSPSSLLGTGRSGSSILALDFGHLEFSMLLHGFSRVGALLPALGFTNSELSALLHSVQCCGFSMLMLNFALQFYVNNQRSLTLIQKPTGASTGNVGGALHGLWYADHMLHISDRRLKKSISSLADDLDKRGQAAGIRQGSGRGAAWLLRQLRPVSYYFKRDVEAKHQRFGFIADEIAVTLPEVVQESSDEKKIKGIAYQDLIAVMVVSVQSLNSRFDEVEGLAAALMSRLVALEENVKMKKLQDWQTVMNRLENLEARC